MVHRDGYPDEVLPVAASCRGRDRRQEVESQWAIAESGASDGVRRDVAGNAYQWGRRGAGAGKSADREPAARARAEPELPSDLWQPGPAAEPYIPDEDQSAEQ
jgi:hypothetical protein